MSLGVLEGRGERLGKVFMYICMYVCMYVCIYVYLLSLVWFGLVRRYC